MASPPKANAVAHLAVTLGLLLGAASMAQAQDPEPEPTPAAPTESPEASTLETARGLGMGTGARASALSTSAAAHNTANLPLAQLYHIESEIGFVPNGGGWWIGGTVVDSVSSKLAAGVSFRGVFDHAASDYSGFDARVGLGLPISDALAIGVAGRYVRIRTDDQSETVDDRGAKGFTLDAALRVTPTEGFHLAALAYNLIDRNSALVPMLVGGGLAFDIVDGLSLGGDGLVDLSTFDSAAVIAGGGLEYLAAGIVPLRLGYRFDSGRDLHSVTGSVGFVDQHVGVDVALRQDVSGSDDTQLLFTFRYHVQ